MIILKIPIGADKAKEAEITTSLSSSLERAPPASWQMVSFFFVLRTLREIVLVFQGTTENSVVGF